MMGSVPGRRSSLTRVRGVAGAFVLGSLAAALPFLFVDSASYSSRESLITSVAAAAMIAAVVLAALSLRLTRQEQQAGALSRWIGCLPPVAAGFFVVGIQCAALSTRNRIAGSPLQSDTETLHFGGYSIDALLVVCCACFVVCTLAVAIYLYRANREERELHQSEMRSGLTVALGRQHAARTTNTALAEQIAEREKAESELARMAQSDVLTGLANRNSLLAAMRQELNVAPTGIGSGKYLLYIDLDRFRSVNELLGHRAGDRVLKETGARLLQLSSTDWTVARLSGDEFAIYCETVKSADHARRIADRILAAIEKPVNLHRIAFPITTSIGICELNARHNSSEEVLRDADTAMHRAKQEGGNRSVFYDSAMHDESLGRIQTTLQLKSALDKGEFELFYQPFVNMQDRSIYGVESLIRWNHPKRGLLNAGEFIQHIHSAGYTVPVGQWVLEGACRDFATIREAVQSDFLMSINVSERQLNEDSFIHELKAAIRKFEIDPYQLQLEIVENAFLGDAARIGALFETIRNMGIRIALDDFGTGYSALGYLQKFPIDTLKIDQSFVRGLQSGSLNSSIVKFLVKLTESAGMTILAEGVEEQAQVDALLESGCSHAQGYLYSRPIPLDALLALVRDGIGTPASRRPMHSFAS